MAKLPLLLYPNPKLRKVSVHVNHDLARTEEYKSFLKNLGETMTWYLGIGISAIQVGVRDRVFAMKTKQGIQYFVNPKLESTDGDLAPVEEGCLSIPGFKETVKRYPGVVVSCFDIESGERKLYDLDGIEAQCAQHEMEHLDGKMFSDGYGVAKRELVRKKIKKALKFDPRFKEMQ